MKKRNILLGMEAFEDRSLPSATAAAGLEDFARVAQTKDASEAPVREVTSTRFVHLGYTRSGEPVFLVLQQVKYISATVNATVDGPRSSPMSAMGPESAATSEMMKKDATPSIVIERNASGEPAIQNGSPTADVANRFVESAFVAPIANAAPKWSFTPIVGDSLVPIPMPLDPTPEQFAIPATPELIPAASTETPTAIESSELPSRFAVAIEEIALKPILGLLPFNSRMVEQSISAFLDSSSDFGGAFVSDISEHWWLAAAGLAAGGAMWSTRQGKESHASRRARPQRLRLTPGEDADGYHS
jgi:hypothetical protein